MNTLKRIGNAALDAARSTLNYITPNSVKNKVKGFTSWIRDYVDPTNLVQVLNKVKEHVKKTYRRKPLTAIENASALRKFTTQYTIEGRDGYDPHSFLIEVKQVTTDLLRKNSQTKVKMILRCTMERIDMQSGEVTTNQAAFHSEVEVNLESTDLNELYNKMTGKVLENLATFQQLGSSWVFGKIDSLEIHTVEYVPLRGSSFIPLPKALADKKAIINLRNKDNQCFKWSVTRGLHPCEDHPERITKDLKLLAEKLNWNGITFPAALNQIGKFEKQNPTISVNVFGYENSVYPLRISEHERENQVDLLLISDNQCFKWSVTRGLHPCEDRPERITKDLKLLVEKLNWDGITFPAALNQIGKFEKQNPTISVNVFEYKISVYPLRISEHEREKQVDLLLVSDEDKQHYCLIKSMSRLLSNQASKHGHVMHFCRRCLNPFNSEGSLAKHTDYCSSHEAIKIEMPQEGSVLKFENFVRSMRVPFVVYADFESFTQQLDTSQPNPECSYTKQYQKHNPSGFCYYIKCFDDSVYNQDPVMYTKQSEDDDVAQTFVEMLEKDLKEIYATCGKAEMVLTPEEQKAFRKATTCWICEEALVKDQSQEDYKNKRPVRDHCHFTGEYRGAAHSICNLQFRKPKFTPILFHNLSGYDSHLFIKNLGKTEGKIDCIPNNEERYISFSKDIKVFNYTDKKTGDDVYANHKLRFIDSFKFMSSSLDRLTSNLTACGECDSCGLGDCLKPTTKRLRETSKICGEKVRLLVRKGVYPYDYMDSLERLNETQLPPKEAFYSKLNKSHISDEDYEHAQKVWSEFDCETMRDYHDLYLKSDVLLLADVFENFRDVCLTKYELDPAWYYTAPGLAWNAALKMTKVELELLSDPDMLLMVEKGIRGGVSSIMHRYSKANNKYMGEDYDPTEPSKYLQYLDANNLYGWAMSKALPTKGFKWMTKEELQDWKNHSCILEVDLEYPKELHNDHNEYPLAPERLTVNKVEKLIPNLNNKTSYVLHYKNLKLYESLGMKVTKIHRGIKFEESPWLKEYIDMNTDLRAKAKNEFEKDFFKLMNNAIYGKTIENVRNHVDIRLVNDKAKARKLAAKPNFQHCTIFDENLVAIHMKKTKLVFNKPVYLGMCILDLSKTLMYDFHYNYIKKKYGSKAKLLFTDTDSLAYEIETEDFYKDISGDVRTNFDTSDISKDHPSGIESGVNKKVIGMFKDECGGKIMHEFVGLRAKLYSYKMYEGHETKKCKGVKSSVVKKEITFKDYKDCLFGGLADGKQMRTMNVIRSHRHEVYTEQVNKIALSAEDDKRVVMQDGVHTLAYGHYSLKKN